MTVERLSRSVISFAKVWVLRARSSCGETILLMDDSGLPQSTRPSLLIRIRDPRDSDAWKTFVDTYLVMIYRYARRLSLQDADAADVSQEVLSEVARCIRSFEYQPEKGRFRDWLGILVRRKVIHFLKKNRRDAEIRATDHPDELESALADTDWNDEFNTQILSVAMERARLHFAPGTWRAFERVWLENQRASDVAAELQMPIDMVYTAKSRALKRLEDEIRNPVRRCSLAFASELSETGCPRQYQPALGHSHAELPLARRSERLPRGDHPGVSG